MTYAVLFDLDGVLIDSAEFHFRAWEWLAAEEGTEISRAFFDETFGMPNSRILPRMFPDRELDEGAVRELGEAKEARYRELVAAELDWAPGARELVAALHGDDRFRQGLFTSTPDSNLRFIDEKLNLSKYMQEILTGDQVANGKPAPDGYRELARRLGVEPERGAVIEDAPAGIAAGRDAGAKVVGVATTHPRERVADVDLVVDGLGELTPERLGRLIGRHPSPA